MTDLFDISHGAGGLWEVHRWNDSLSMNVQDVADQIRINRITGLTALPDHEDPRDRKTGRIGESPRPASFAGKTVVYEGELRAATVPLLRQQRTALLAAFANLAHDGYMELIPDAVAGGPTAVFFARVLQLDPPEEQTSRYFRRDFTLALRLGDPRIYYPSLAVDETASPATVTNPGSAPSDPILTVAGASGTVTVSNGASTLKFRNCPSGSLVIDFGARSAKVGSTPVELVVADSDWWDSHVAGIPPGVSTISQTGGSSVRVQFTPATWG